MTARQQLDHPERIAGYDYGAPHVPRSLVTLEELERLEAAVGLSDDDEVDLRMAGEVLADQPRPRSGTRAGPAAEAALRSFFAPRSRVDATLRMGAVFRSYLAQRTR